MQKSQNNRKLIFCKHLAIIWLVLAFISSAQAASRPNIIFIFADDLGYGDLTSFGSTTISTPNIDSLATRGMKFTSFYAASNVCSPSRAALLTGRYPFRSGVNTVYYHDSIEGMPQSEITIAELLQQAGYHTGLIGKWHLGMLDRHMPWNQGFDEFYGTPHSNDMGNFYWYENRDIELEPIDQRLLTQRYTQKALTFIEQHRDRPFFLYIAHNMPHVPLYVSPEFAGRSAGGLYGDVVEELDWSVGKILQQLERSGIADNTLVVFTSDNGPMLAMRSHGGSAGELRGGKSMPYEGGQRVPLLARWPNTIPAGTQYTLAANMMDWFPTFATLAGAPLPEDRIIDGRSLTAVLANRGVREETPFYYFQVRIPNITSQEHEFAAVRSGNWKLVLPRRGFYPRFLDPLIKIGQYHRKLELFDLDNDPGESVNLAAQHPDKVAELSALLDDFREHAQQHQGRATQPVALPADHSDQKYLYYGIGSMLAVFLAVGLATLYIVYRLFKWIRARLRQP